MEKSSFRHPFFEISFLFFGGCNFIILGLKLTAIMSCVVAWAKQNFNPVLIMVTTGYRQPVQLFPLCLGCCYKRWWTVKRCDFGGIRIGRLKWTTCKALFQWVCLILTLCFSYSEILKLSSSHVTHSRDIFSAFSRWELETAESWEHVNWTRHVWWAYPDSRFNLTTGNGTLPRKLFLFKGACMPQFDMCLKSLKLYTRKCNSW